MRRARSFGRIAADYHRFRPRTPAGMLDWLLPDGVQIAVDLAAGTGALSESLAGRAGLLISVEPDAGMRAVLARAVPSAYALGGTAEALPLATASVDAVLVASAWHWFDPERATAEIARILRDHGRLALVGSSFDTDVAWVRSLRRPLVADPRALPSASAPDLPTGAPFTSAETRDVRWVWRLNPDDVLGLLGTYSRVITAGADDRAAIRRAAQAVLAARPRNPDGTIELPMRTWGTRTARLARVDPAS